MPNELKPLCVDGFCLSQCKAFLGLFCAIGAISTADTEAGYTFTNIADTAGAFGYFYFESTSFNNAGAVAFRADLDDGSRGIFSGNGGSTAAISVSTLPFASYGEPSINDSGTVAFPFFPGGFTPMPDGIYAGSGGPLVTIADTTGQFKSFAGGYSTAIDSTGAVAFLAALDAGSGGIFLNSGGVISPILVGAGGEFSRNDSGMIAFRMGSGGTSLVRLNAGSLTTIADNSGTLNHFGSAPSMNEAGIVAFVAGVEGVDGAVFGVYKGNGGPLTTIADISGPFSAFGDFNFNQPSINDAGNVAFVAGLDTGGGGIFIGDGSETSQVVGFGDSLFGSTITSLSISPTSLNDNGQVAFFYGLADGTTGIAVANPVPEPSSSLLAAFSLVLGLARRPLRK
jgi:hypothetical protein